MNGEPKKKVKSFMELDVDMKMLEKDDTVVPLADTRAMDAQAVKKGINGSSQGTNKPVKVKELSRLWQYRNGRTPKD